MFDTHLLWALLKLTGGGYFSYCSQSGAFPLSLLSGQTGLTLVLPSLSSPISRCVHLEKQCFKNVSIIMAKW